jgi:hypothetical protein
VGFVEEVRRWKILVGVVVAGIERENALHGTEAVHKQAQRRVERKRGYANVHVA